MYVMSMIDRGTRSVNYWTGFDWTLDKAEAKRYKSQQEGFDAKAKANLAMPVNVNKE